MSAEQYSFLLEGSGVIKQLADYLALPSELKIQNIEQLCDVHKKRQVGNPLLIRGHLHITFLSCLKHPHLKKTAGNFPSAQPSHLLVVKHITILCIHLIQQSLELTVRQHLEA